MKVFPQRVALVRCACLKTISDRTVAKITFVNVVYSLIKNCSTLASNILREAFRLFNVNFVDFVFFKMYPDP